MKYIDSEKLKAKIEKRMNILDIDSPFGIGGRVELELVLDAITSLQQEQPQENKLPNKRARVNYAICKLQSFKPLREAIVLDDYVYDESKCYRENLLNYIHVIPESRLTEIRSYLKEKGWWTYDDDADWGEQKQQEMDLEKEIDRYFNPHGMALQFDRSKGNTILKPEQLIKFARHFAEWGAIHLNARKEESNEIRG